MIQEIIVAIIGIVVAGLVLYKFFGFFFSKPKSKTACGCSSCGCSTSKKKKVA